MEDDKNLPPLFTGAGYWQEKARIHAFSDRPEAYAQGYRLAADTLVQHVMVTARHQDTLLFPIAFLYRHYLELRLKGIISDGRQLLDNGIGYPTHHRIDDLWDDTKGLMREIWRKPAPQEYHLMDHVISEFARRDPEGETFRYAQTKDGQETLSDIPLINLRHLAESIGEVADLLDGVSTEISRYLDYKSEMLAAYDFGAYETDATCPGPASSSDLVPF